MIFGWLCTCYFQRRFRDGSVKFCVEDGEGNYRVTKQLHLQSFLES